MTENENPKTEVLSCERCEQDDASPTTEGVKTYDPRVPGEPYRTVNLCPKCAENEPNTMLITPAEPPLEGKALDEAIAEIKAEGTGTKEGRAADNEAKVVKFEEIKTVSFEPVTPEPIQETIVTPKSKIPKASKNLAKDVETPTSIVVSGQLVEEKIARQEKDIDTLQSKRKELVEQANKLTNQINQISGLITQKIGAVAGLRDLLGND